MKSKVNLYMNRDKTEVVPEGDKDAAFLLVRAGKDMSESDMDVYGEGLGAKAKALIAAERSEAKEEKAAAEAPAEEKEVEAPAENKAVEAPAENKSKRGAKG